MSIEESIKKRIVDLIDRAQCLIRTPKASDLAEKIMVSDKKKHECISWVCAVKNIISLSFLDKENPYRKNLNDLLKNSILTERDGLSKVSAASEILKMLIEDINAGLLYSITDPVRAETFDNFLDHAKSYLSDNRIKEAGVIAGVVFEDSVRRICEKHGISQKGIKLDELINELVRAQKITQLKAKRARVSAHVRTKATHAQWDEFDAGDVQVTIEFTEEIILNHLDS